MHRNRRRGSSILIGVALVLGAAAPAVATPGPTSTAVAIRAAYNVTPRPDLACGGLRAKGVGTATGSPVGPSTWADNECASLIAQLGRVVITGQLVITGAHGAIRISYSATAPLPLLLTIHPKGTFTITGGTGDFAGATGHGTVTASGSLIPPGPAVAVLTGVLQLPG